jgi:hypothetical protein
MQRVTGRNVPGHEARRPGGGTAAAYQVSGSRVKWNPAAARLREPTEERPNAPGNRVRKRKRSTRSTYLVDDPTSSRGQTITRTEYDRVAAIQDAHIAEGQAADVGHEAMVARLKQPWWPASKQERKGVSRLLPRPG